MFVQLVNYIKNTLRRVYIPVKTTIMCAIRETSLILNSSYDVINGLEAISPIEGNFASYRR